RRLPPASGPGSGPAPRIHVRARSGRVDQATRSGRGPEAAELEPTPEVLVTNPLGRSSRLTSAPLASTGPLVALAAALLAARPAHAEVVYRPSPIEAVCPMPPEAVRADGRSALCYELHLTNFGPEPLTLRRVDIFGETVRGAAPARAPDRPLATLAD